MQARGALLLVCGACSIPSLGESESESPVVGGHAAQAGKWPDATAVMFNGQQGCTGTLIAPTVVLTAGHCNESSLRTVMVGGTSLSQADGETIQVKQRFEYPSSQTSEDLTVLVLQQASTKTPRAIATGWARFDIANGATVAVVGYGATDANASQYPDRLQEATTTITDADCSTSSGCYPAAQPAGELGAGTMGIDSCNGDSGGPLYLVTSYGAFLAGVTSRAYDNATAPCGEGGIYVRPDKVVAWIEQKAGVPVGHGPAPAADRLTVVRGNGVEGQITHNDPVAQAHTFTIKTPPTKGMAKVRDDGHVKLCANADATPGDDSLVVTVADAGNAARALDVTVPVTVSDGTPGTCSLDDMQPPPDDGGMNPPGDPPGDPSDPHAMDGDHGGCSAGGLTGAGGLPIALGVLAIRRRRRR